MYTVKYGDKYLHDAISEDSILDGISLSIKANNCGYCDFTIHPTHPLYSELRERDTINLIRVYDGTDEIFVGFIYEITQHFQKDCDVSCKGELAYTEDTMIGPYSTFGKIWRASAPSTIDGFFAWLINEHNSRTTAACRFEIGINEGRRFTEHNYIDSESDTYNSTYDLLTSELLERFGGYVRVRYEGSRRIIDYLYEYADVGDQMIDFGVNLLDYTKTTNSEDVATFCVATGCKLSETDFQYDNGYRRTTDVQPDPDKKYYTKDKNGSFSEQKDLTYFKPGTVYYEYFELKDQSDELLTLAYAPNGTYGDGIIKMDDFVYDVNAVAARGWIGTVYSDSEIKIADDLLLAAMAHLRSSITSKLTLELKAVDMHLLNPDLKPIHIGEYIRCRSSQHNLDGYFLCSEIELDLNSPEQSTYTLGVAYDTLTGAQSKRIVELNRSINSNYDAAVALSQEAKQAAQDAGAVANQVKENAENSIYDTMTEYAIGDSSEVPPSDPSAWDTVYPTVQEGKFIWVRTVNIYGNGTTEVSDPFVSNAGGGGGDGEDATVLKISSSKGLLFKSSEISTSLTATLYKGPLLITNISQLEANYGTTAHLQWYEKTADSESWTAIPSTDPRLLSNGFVLTVTVASISNSATFRCELVV